MVVWWGCDIEEMNGIYTRTSMSSVLGLGVGVGVGTGTGLISWECWIEGSV